MQSTTTAILTDTPVKDDLNAEKVPQKCEFIKRFYQRKNED